jgi:LuxR family maltose regulon positive regulatory protein
MRFAIPRKRHNTIRRARLLDALHDWPHLRLISIVAPAGYGKTTLAVDWLHLPEVAEWAQRTWWSLSAEDDEPNIFLQRLSMALAYVAPAVDAITDVFRTGGIEHTAAVHLLVEGIASVPQSVVLVLDDFHFIRSAEVLSLVEALLTTAPNHFHLVLLSRTPPPLRTARMQLADAQRELRQHDLAFDRDETTLFIERGALANLSPEERDAILQRTEGWAAALQMLQIAQPFERSVALANPQHDPLGFSDFLNREVLRHTSHELYSALLRLSLLPYLTEPLVTETLEIPHSAAAALLQQIIQSNLLITLLGHDQIAVRFHPLLRDFLRRSLEAQLEGAERLSITRRSAHALAANGQIESGFDLLMESGAADDAASLLTGHSRRMLLEGNIIQLQSWLSRIPPEVASLQPFLALDAAWNAIFAGSADMRTRSDAAAAAIHSYAALHSADPRIDEWTVESHIVNGLCAFIESNMEAARRAVYAVDAIPHDPHGLAECWRIMLSTFIPNFIPDYHERIRLMQIGADRMQKLGFVVGAVEALCTQAAMRMRFLDSGAIHSADAACSIASHGGRHLNYSVPATQFQRGEIFYLCDRITDARAAFLHTLQSYNAIDAPPAWSYFTRLMLQMCDLAGPEAMAAPLDDTEDAYLWSLTRSYYMPVHLGAIAWMRILRDLRRSRPQDCWLTVAAFDMLPHDVDSATPPWVAISVLAGSLFAGQHLDALPRHFDAFIDNLDATQNHSIALRMRILKSVLLLRLDRREEARSMLHALLPSLEHSQQPRILLDIPEVEPLLLDIDEPFARKLLHRINPNAVVAQITEREREILRQLATSHINKEIAHAISISLNTLKVHTHNLYRKLNVHDRQEAVARARELGLIT